MLMQKTIFNMDARLSEYSEELSKELWFTPVVLGIMVTETIDPKSWLCEKMIKGASVVLPAMPDPDFIEYERKYLSPWFIDPAYYGLISNEFIYHSENHEVEISWVLIFTNRPKFQEEFDRHTERVATKIIRYGHLTMKDETLLWFHETMTDREWNPIDYRFEYVEGLEITVPEGQLADKYLCTWEICKDCGGVKEACC